MITYSDGDDLPFKVKKMGKVHGQMEASNPQNNIIVIIMDMYRQQQPQPKLGLPVSLKNDDSTALK